VKVFTPQDWFWREGELFARVSSITQTDIEHALWETGPVLEKTLLSEFDVILMRQDPPVDSQYVYATYALEHVERAGVLVSNRPQSVRDTNEKFAITHYPDLIIPTLVSLDKKELRDFWEVHQVVVYKPLNAFGGENVFYVDESGKNLAVILDLLTDHGTRTIMAQRYIPAIKEQGDKRILMIHGELVEVALARIPAKNDWRGNLAAGASGKVVPLTDRDRAICAAVSPALKAKGLHFVGLDVIGDYLTEINVTSPTCLCEIEKATELDLTGTYWRGIKALLT
jgi:glutathione synthase